MSSIEALQLEPCPFCGQKPRFDSHRSPLDLRDGWFARVSCHGLGFITHMGVVDAEEETQDEAERKAAERWNAWTDRAQQRFGNPRAALLENLLRRYGIEVPE